MHLREATEGRVAQYASTGANVALRDKPKRKKSALDKVLCKHGWISNRVQQKKAVVITSSSLIFPLFLSPLMIFLFLSFFFFFLPLGNKTRGTVVKCQKQHEEAKM